MTLAITAGWKQKMTTNNCSSNHLDSREHFLQHCHIDCGLTKGFDSQEIWSQIREADLDTISIDNLDRKDLVERNVDDAPIFSAESNIIRAKLQIAAFGPEEQHLQARVRSTGCMSKRDHEKCSILQRRKVKKVTCN